jgi:hypothetical protein
MLLIKLFCVILLAALTLPLQAIGVENIGAGKVVSAVGGELKRNKR